VKKKKKKSGALKHFKVKETNTSMKGTSAASTKER